MAYGVQLKPDERVERHPFSDPEHTGQDRATMRGMARQLVDTYRDPQACDFSVRSGPVCLSDPHGRHFRIYYIAPERLFRLTGLAVVGFFGHKRPKADLQPLIRADKRFEAEFHNHPGLLSLSTVRVANGNFGNLVVFSDPDSVATWNHGPVHQDLVARISPPYYRSVRINNGWLPAGLAEPDRLWIERVKYIDYSVTPIWRAERRLPGTAD